MLKHFIIFHSLFTSFLPPISLTMSLKLPNITPEFPCKDFLLLHFHSDFPLHSSLLARLLSFVISHFLPSSLFLPALLLPLLRLPHSRSFFPLANMESLREVTSPYMHFHLLYSLEGKLREPTPPVITVCCYKLFIDGSTFFPPPPPCLTFSGDFLNLVWGESSGFSLLL